MQNPNFKILKKDTKTKARLGILSTPHGKVKTPSYVIVATYGHIRHLKPADIKKTKTQLLICNTYHLWDKALEPNAKNIVPSLLGTKIPAMTDSGGFQVFSLAFGQDNKVSKILGKENILNKPTRKNIKIAEKGVYFKLNGANKFLGPELSVRIQEKLGADIIFAFDECTSPLDDYEYNIKALKRTHKWAKLCLATKTRKDQMLFGIVQGGLDKELRVQSAKFTASLPFDGFGIGGSFNKEQISKVLKWIIPYLPDQKPRHLLGIGKIEDIFMAVENGVDTFDCVIPTREARHGRIWTSSGKIDIRRGAFKNDGSKIEKGCKCPTCSKSISRSRLNNLFKSPAEKDRALAQRYALLHNIWFFNNLLEKIRGAIEKRKFGEFKQKFLSRFQP